MLQKLLRFFKLLSSFLLEMALFGRNVNLVLIQYPESVGLVILRRVKLLDDPVAKRAHCKYHFCQTRSKTEVFG